MNQEVLKAKQSVVKEIVEKAQASSSIVVMEYRGLTVSETQELRRALLKEDSEMCVYKNSLVERAVKELGYTGLDEILSGPNAIVFSKEINKGPKVVSKFAKKYENLVIKGGVAEGKFLDVDGVKSIANIPGREGLLSMFLSCLQAPVRQFAATVKAVADAK